MKKASAGSFLRGPDGWQRAELSFNMASDGLTKLHKQFTQYPFHITKPFHLDSAWPELATLILQSTSGGLYRDDRLKLSLKFGEKTCTHVTTQSATKVHSMEAGGFAKLRVLMDVQEGAHAEFINDALIMFPNSRLENELLITIAEGSSAIITDSVLWHEPRKSIIESGHINPQFESLRQFIKISRPNDSQPAVRELQWSGKESPAGLSIWNNYKVQGSIYSLCPGGPIDKIVKASRDLLSHSSSSIGGVSILPMNMGVVVRIIGKDGETVRVALEKQWRKSRLILSGREDGLIWKK